MFAFIRKSSKRLVKSLRSSLKALNKKFHTVSVIVVEQKFKNQLTLIII